MNTLEAQRLLLIARTQTLLCNIKLLNLDSKPLIEWPSDLKADHDTILFGFANFKILNSLLLQKVKNGNNHT